MLRNIPNKYTQSALLEEIDASGFAETFDFFYLPMDVHNRANVGYAFINFLRPEDMSRFAAAFTDYVFEQHPSQKIARVSPAHIQGLVENLRHFSNRAVTWARNSQYRPLVKYQGRQRELCELLAELDSMGKAEFNAAFNASAPEFIPEAMDWTGVFNPVAAKFCPMGFEQEMAALAFDDELAAAAGFHMGFNPEAAVFVPEVAADPPDDAGEVDMPPGLEALLADNPWDGSAQAPTAVMAPPLACDAEAAALRRDAAQGAAGGEISESFSAARAGLQEAVSKWLQGKQLGATRGDASAAEDSSTRGSSNPSPRSTPKAEAAWQDVGSSLAGVGAA